MVTALDQPEDRVRGLEAGADDFLTKPVNDVALFCRVKGLVRLKMLTDELRARTGVDPLGLDPDGTGTRNRHPAVFSSSTTGRPPENAFAACWRPGTR